MKVIIIGNGVAGMTVAQNLRRYKEDFEIHTYTDEDYGYYSRVWLPQLISEKKTADSIIMRDAIWYAEKNIQYHQNIQVISIDPQEKIVKLENGKKETYDKLCVCTGARNFIPPIKNANINGVFTLRTIDDALKIREYIKDKERIICIGGGLLGLETAKNIRDTGKNVTVVEYFPRLLPKQLCNTSATILEDKINNLGIRTILGTTAEEILGENTVKGVRLTNGSELEGGAIVISAGIRANLDLVKDAGLKINKCLVVNEYMQTSDPDIYAAGDVIEYNERGWGIIPAALDQANIAAKCIASKNCEAYESTTPSNKLKILDFDLMSTGSAILGDAQGDCKVFISKDEMKGVFKKFVLRDGKLIGSILLESKNDESFVKKNINKDVSEEEVKQRLVI